MSAALKAALSVPRAKPAPRTQPAAKAVAAGTAVQTATVRHETLPRKNSHWPTRLPWPPHHAVTCRRPKPAAKSASRVKHASPANPAKRVAKAGVNAVAAATSVVMKRQSPKALPPPMEKRV